MSKRITHPDIIDVKGPGPFVTKRIYKRPDHFKVIWQSRHFRKGLRETISPKLIFAEHVLKKSLWMPQNLNWWIGLIFSIGSLFFIAGSVLFLFPALAKFFSLNDEQVNVVFFMGSIPFTIAAYLQLFQAANAGEFTLDKKTNKKKIRLFGWMPSNLGWLSCALQFVGTILFNINTFDALIPGLNWVQEDIVIWAPNFVGSILFLASGYMAFAETNHSYWSWKWNDISWWVTFVNLIGCIGFMISALFAFFLPFTPSIDLGAISLVFTLIGAFGFLFGSLLMWPEAVSETQE